MTQDTLLVALILLINTGEKQMEMHVHSITGFADKFGYEDDPVPISKIWLFSMTFYTKQKLIFPIAFIKRHIVN